MQRETYSDIQLMFCITPEMPGLQRLGKKMPPLLGMLLGSLLRLPIVGAGNRHNILTQGDWPEKMTAVAELPMTTSYLLQRQHTHLQLRYAPSARPITCIMSLKHLCIFFSPQPFEDSFGPRICRHPKRSWW